MKNSVTPRWLIRMTSVPRQQNQARSLVSSANPHLRRDEHKAPTGNADEESYILTLLTDTSHHGEMTAIRNKYFPPKLNKLEAHIALFRALPKSQLPRIKDDIAQTVSTMSPFDVNATEPFRMRAGVGIRVVDKSPSGTIIKDMHTSLRDRWSMFLSRQDRGDVNPHYTIQNKVDDQKSVDRTLKELKTEFHNSQGAALGVRLWRYDKGWWREEEDFLFPTSR
jgi:hypothetical protein